jgi:hypothetical protein
VLARAREVNASYTPPKRTAISGPLLDVTFKAYYEEAKEINELCSIAKMVSKVLLCFVATLF